MSIILRGRKKEAKTVLKGERKRSLEKQADSRLSALSQGSVVGRFLGRSWWPSVTNAE